MSKLKNNHHEQYCRELVRNGFNQTQAYAKAYPAASYDTARNNGSRLLTDASIKSRVAEILESSPRLNLAAIIQSLEEDLKAKKYVITSKGKRIALRDNSNILETKKFIINKLYGIGLPSNINVTDNRRINLTLNNTDINKLSAINDSLQALSANLKEKRAIKERKKGRNAWV